MRRTCTTVPDHFCRCCQRRVFRVLSIGKLAAGAGDYYTAMVAQGAEEYFTGAREAPGEWIGGGADDLALSGTVERPDFAAILDHRDPGTGERITAARSAPKVVGFDATFCAPKSVSVLHGLGTAEVSREIREAHDVSVWAALAVFEVEACRGRRGHGGATLVEGDGFVAAAFRHRTSRAGDPHLHTHAVIANIVRGPDERWTALDARPLYHWAKTVGYLYEAQLRHELTSRLGADWTPVRRGIADLQAVPAEVTQEFSTRRREIRAHLEASGFDSARAAQLAAYATRQMKDHNATGESLAAGWQQRADALGFDAHQASDDLLRRRFASHSSARIQVEMLFTELAGPDGLTRNRSTFGRRDVIQALCDRLPTGAPVAEVMAWAERFLESPHCVHLAGRFAPAIRTRAGAMVAARTDETRFTTPDMLATERRLVDSALRRIGDRVAQVPLEDVNVTVDAHPTLSDEQLRMLWQICWSGRGVEMIEGVAGAGKTYTLDAARQAWQLSGHRVIGCALAANAARQLERDAGIPSETIDRLLIDLDRPEHGGLAPDTVVVVDEAAMVGSRKLVPLLEHAERAHAKIVLIGDPCQLPEIEAGGAFVGLAARLGDAALIQNRRQQHQWERVALARLRAGHVDAAVNEYFDRGAITITENLTEARSRLLDDWMAVRTEQSSMILASRRADREHLNVEARHRLQLDGVIGPDEVTLGGRGYVAGDLVLALRNDRRLGVLNGTRAVVESVDAGRQMLLCRTEDHEPLALPFTYADDGHLTHAYAMTVHKAQGATFDRCFVLAGDQLTKESAYTALSRARLGTDLYVTSDDPRQSEAHMDELHRQPLDLLRASVRRSGAQTMAVDSVAPSETSVDDDLGMEMGS